MKLNNKIIEYKDIIILCFIYYVISFCLLLLWSDKALLASDSQGYINIAKNIISKFFFSQDGVDPDYFRTPGYPLFLATIFYLGGNLNFVIIAQVLISGICIVLAYKTLLLIGFSKNVAKIGTALLLLDLTTYQYSHTILSESLFASTLMISLYFFVKWTKSNFDIKYMLGFALCLNYALLIRPILIYFNLIFCIVLLLSVLLKKMHIKQVIIFSIAFLLVFGTWSYRNYSTSNLFTYSTVRNYNLLYFDGEQLCEMVENINNKDATIYMDKLFENKYPDIDKNSLNQAQLHKLYGIVGSQYIQEHFSQYILQNIRGLFTTMFGPSNSFLISVFGKNAFINTFILLYISYLGIIYLIYITGLIVNIKKISFIDLYIFCLCGYLACASASLGYSRFRTAFIQIIVLGSIIAWKSNHKEILKRRV